MDAFKEISVTPSAWVLPSAALTSDRLDASYYEPVFLRASAQLEGLPYKVASFRQISNKLNCGATPKLVEYGNTGVPLIRTSNVRPNLYDSTDTLRVPGFSVKKDSNIAILPADVLYTMSGSIGYAAVYPEGGELASCSNTIARARLLEDGDVDPYYVAAFLNSSIGKLQSDRLVSGGVLAHVMPNSVKRLRVALPSSDIQRAIGNKLRKAGRLRVLKQCELEAVERAILSFMSADKSAKTLRALKEAVLNESGRSAVWVRPGSVTQRIDASYYQERFVHLDSFVRRVDRVKPLGDLAPNLCNGPHGGITYVNNGQGVRYIRAKNVGEYSVNDEDPIWISEADHKQHVRGEVLPGDLVITITGANIGAVGVVPKTLCRGNIIQSLAKARIESDDDPYYVCAFLASPYGQMLIRRESVNTAREGINFEYLGAVPIPLPSFKEQARIGMHLRTAEGYGRESIELRQSAASQVESLIRGTLDYADIASENEAIESWLKANPYCDIGRRP